MDLAIFYIFWSFLSFIIFDSISEILHRYICELFNIIINDTFGFGSWVYKIPITLWLSSILFTALSSVLYFFNREKTLAQYLKVSIVTFIILFLLSSFLLVKFYLE